MSTLSQIHCPAPIAKQDTVFIALRERLTREVHSSALLAELLERVTRMQCAQTSPELFKEHFEKFVHRAEEYIDAVRPLFPALVDFLPFDSRPR